MNDFVKRFSLPENLNMADMLVDPSALNESLTQEDKLEYTEVFPTFLMYSALLTILH